MESRGKEQCVLAVLLSREPVVGLPLTLVEAGLGRSHLGVQVSLRRVWMIRTRTICVLG